MTGWRALPRSPALPWLLGLAAVVAAGLLAGRQAERAALADLRRSATATLALHVAAFRTEMQKQARCRWLSPATRRSPRWWAPRPTRA